MVEYLIVTGFCALVAILAFHRFGRNVHTHLDQQAEHVHNPSTPNAADLIDQVIEPPVGPGGCAITWPLTCEPNVPDLPSGGLP
jgi:hypothetical protein